MTINANLDGGKLTVALEGRLDTGSAPQLESMLREKLRGHLEKEGYRL